jgi:hypothetical protein
LSVDRLEASRIIECVTPWRNLGDCFLASPHDEPKPPLISRVYFFLSTMCYFICVPTIEGCTPF